MRAGSRKSSVTIQWRRNSWCGCTLSFFLLWQIITNLVAQNNINLLSYSSGVSNSKMHLEGCVLFGGSRREFISLPIASINSSNFLVRGPHHSYLFPFSHLLHWLWLASLPFSLEITLQKTWDDIGPTWRIQDNCPISRFLTSSAKFLLLCKVTYPQVLEIRTWTCLEGHYSAYHNKV